MLVVFFKKYKKIFKSGFFRLAILEGNQTTLLGLLVLAPFFWGSIQAWSMPIKVGSEKKVEKKGEKTVLHESSFLEHFEYRDPSSRMPDYRAPLATPHPRANERILYRSEGTHELHFSHSQAASSTQLNPEFPGSAQVPESRASNLSKTRDPFQSPILPSTSAPFRPSEAPSSSQDRLRLRPPTMIPSSEQASSSRDLTAELLRGDRGRTSPLPAQSGASEFLKNYGGGILTGIDLASNAFSSARDLRNDPVLQIANKRRESQLDQLRSDLSSQESQINQALQLAPEHADVSRKLTRQVHQQVQTRVDQLSEQLRNWSPSVPQLPKKMTSAASLQQAGAVPGLSGGDSAALDRSAPPIEQRIQAMHEAKAAQNWPTLAEEASRALTALARFKASIGFNPAAQEKLRRLKDQIPEDLLDRQGLLSHLPFAETPQGDLKSSLYSPEGLMIREGVNNLLASQSVIFQKCSDAPSRLMDDCSALSDYTHGLMDSYYALDHHSFRISKTEFDQVADSLKIPGQVLVEFSRGVVEGTVDFITAVPELIRVLPDVAQGLYRAMAAPGDTVEWMKDSLQHSYDFIMNADVESLKEFFEEKIEEFQALPLEEKSRLFGRAVGMFGTGPAVGARAARAAGLAFRSVEKMMVRSATELTLDHAVRSGAISRAEALTLKTMAKSHPELAKEATLQRLNPSSLGAVGGVDSEIAASEGLMTGVAGLGQEAEAPVPIGGHLRDRNRGISSQVQDSLGHASNPAASTTQVGNSRVSGFFRGVDDSLRSLRIHTPAGEVAQDMTSKSLLARQRVLDGAMIYRIGTREISQAGRGAQFWSLEHPLLTPNFAGKYGIPPENVSQANFIERARVRPGAKFITQPAAGVGQNLGGGIEVVVPGNGTSIEILSHTSI
ncbi:MAG: hypothetical protein ACO3A2_09605 [Bdellovibrionia bacterium]